MAVITQNYDVDLKATGERPVVKMSQFDTGSRTIVFTVYDGHELAHIDGMVARVDGTRSDGVEFSRSCTVGTGSKVSFTISQEMTKVAGKHAAELVIIDASGNPIGTQNFLLEVEAAPMVRDSAASADDRTLYDQYTDSVEAKFNSLSASLTAKADALNKTVQDIDALLGGSSKQTTIFDVSVDASTTGTGITGTALGHAEYNPITGLVTFVAKTVDGLHGVKGAQQFQLGVIDSKYLPAETLFKSDGWYDHASKVFLVGYDRIDDEGYGAESYVTKDGKVYASFVYPLTATGDENAYRPVFYATWYARGGKFIGVTPMTGGNTLTIGKTTTGEPGTQASVVNSGTAKDVVLDFTIPRGGDGTGGSANVYGESEGSVKIAKENDADVSHYGVAIGSNANAGDSAIAIGTHAVAIGATGTAVGPYANAANYGSVAIGESANSFRYSVAIGLGAKTTAEHCVAIGEDSLASEPYTVSFDYVFNEQRQQRRLVGVATPVNGTDATNKSYVDSRIEATSPFDYKVFATSNYASMMTDAVLSTESGDAGSDDDVTANSILYKNGMRLYADYDFYIKATKDMTIDGDFCTFDFADPKAVIDTSTGVSAGAGAALFTEMTTDEAGPTTAKTAGVGWVMTYYDEEKKKFVMNLYSPELKAGKVYAVNFTISDLLRQYVVEQ